MINGKSNGPMSTLTPMLKKALGIPALVAWTVAGTEHYRGRQDLYMKPSPQVYRGVPIFPKAQWRVVRK